MIEERRNAKLTAKDIVHLKITENVKHLSDKKIELQKALRNVLLPEANKKRSKASYLQSMKGTNKNWNYNPGKTHGITQEEMERISAKEIAQRCQSWKIENT